MVTIHPPARHTEPGDTPPSEIAARFESKEHPRLRETAARLDRATRALDRTHGGTHTLPGALRREFVEFQTLLYGRLVAESRILFPMIRRLEGRGDRSTASRSAVALYVHELEAEHPRFLKQLDNMRRMLQTICSIPGAPIAALAAADILTDLERETRCHLHAESTLLFPSAIALERRAQRTTETQ